MTGPRSLVDMCLKVVLKNAAHITSLENMAPKFIPDILRNVKSAEQLRTIELNSSDEFIYDETAPHWQRLIQRDFGFLSRRHNYAPSDNRDWHKVYAKYKEMQRESEEAATASLMKRVEDHRREAEQRKTQVMEISQLRPSMKRALTSRSARGGGSGGSTPWVPPRPKQTFLQKTARQLRNESRQLQLKTPTGRLAVPPGQITNAPKSMLERLRRSRQADPLAPVLRQPPPSIKAVVNDPDRKARENRLLQLKRSDNTNDNSAPPTILTFDDNEEPKIMMDVNPKKRSRGYLDDLEDDLFDSDGTDGMSADSQPVARNSTASSPPADPQSPPVKRRRTLLSAAPGANKFTAGTSVTSPTSQTPSSQWPASRPSVPKPGNPAPPSAPRASGSVNTFMPSKGATKRNEVASRVFMAPKKRPVR